MTPSALENEINLLHERICVALGDPKRILLLYMTADGGKTVNELTELLGVPQSTVSRHLRVLRERGLVNTTRAGTSIIYTISDPRLVEALDLLRQVLNKQLSDQVDLTATFIVK